MASTQEDLQLTLDTLQPARTTPADQHNRLCISISDLHFTDGTVGTQSAEETVWTDFFDDLINTCGKQNITELTLLLDGDVADMIRSSVWAETGVYPWQRSDPRFKECLAQIMKGILALHAKPPVDATPTQPAEPGGFFHHLQNLQTKLPGVKLEILAFLGNHDKEILADPEILRTFYEQCLGQRIADLSAEYRAWIGTMYFDDPQHFAAADSVPWLPFYWGDADLRLFVTHGQWRDRSNCLAASAADGLPGWNTGDGWRAKSWQQLRYRPFTEPCFGDTIAAGVLSTFIWKTKQALKPLHPVHGKELKRIECILDELDLYRPTSAAVSRILEETRRSSTSEKVRNIIEHELYQALCEWLNWDFTLKSAPSGQRLGLQVAKVWLMLTGPLQMLRIQLYLVRGILQILDWLEQIRPTSVYSEDGASIKNLKVFPTFQTEFLARGFRLHGEGHTHIPLEAEADIQCPAGSPSCNFTYVNFGTWRDQVVSKENGGYRRRGVARTLSVLHRHLLPRPEYRYYLSDGLNWSDNMDSF